MKKPLLIIIPLLLIAFLLSKLSSCGLALRQEPWHEPAKTGNTKEIQRLVESGLSPNAEDQNGDTPLTYALWGEHIGTAKYLMSQGADPYHKNHRGQSVLDRLHYVSTNEKTIQWFVLELERKEAKYRSR